MMDISTYVISFFIYSVLGYISEVIFCSVPKKRFVNRGFLYGPYCPIYGFGALVVTVLLTPFKAHWYLVFIFGLILTSAIEYVTSWLLEKLFHMKLWDYSNHRININGRVCGLNSFLFGLMGLFVMYVVDPFAQSIIARIPLYMRNFVTDVILIGLSIDATITVTKLKSFQKGLEDIKEKAELIRNLDSAELKKILSSELEKSRERRAEAFSHFLAANPSLSARSEEIAKELNDYRVYLERRALIKREYKKALKENRADFIEKRNK